MSEATSTIGNIELPLDDILESLQTGIDNWKKENTPEMVTKETIDYLNQNKKTAVRKLLGFDQRWGKDGWELDHCNGRSGNSPAGDYLLSVRRAAINEWMATVEFDDMTQQMKKTMKEDYKKRIDYEFRKQLNKRIETHISEVVTDILEDFTRANTLDIRKKLEAAIGIKS